MRPLHERSEMCAYSSYLFSFASRGTVDQDIQSAAAWRDYEGSSNICHIHQPKPGLIGTEASGRRRWMRRLQENDHVPSGIWN